MLDISRKIDINVRVCVCVYACNTKERIEEEEVMFDEKKVYRSYDCKSWPVVSIYLVADSERISTG